MAGDNCVFCQIISGKIPSKKEVETDTYIAIRDLHPQAPSHVLFIPKTHVASLNEVTDFGMVAGLLEGLQKFARTHGLDRSGYRTIINTGKGGGQSVFHLHVHLLSGRPMSESLG